MHEKLFCKSEIQLICPIITNIDPKFAVAAD